MLRLLNAPELGIGEVARRTGLTTRAIRFYEESGLLQSFRSGRGARRYDGAMLDRLAFIGLARDAGLSIPQIRGLLSLGENQDDARRLRLQDLYRNRLDRIEAEREAVERSARAMGVPLPPHQSPPGASSLGKDLSNNRALAAVRGGGAGGGIALRSAIRAGEIHDDHQH